MLFRVLFSYVTIETIITTNEQRFNFFASKPFVSTYFVHILQLIIIKHWLFARLIHHARSYTDLSS